MTCLLIVYKHTSCYLWIKHPLPLLQPALFIITAILIKATLNLHRLWALRFIGISTVISHTPNPLRTTLHKNMSDNKLIFENIKALSSTPGKWTIFKFKMLTAFNAKGWGGHLTWSSDHTDKPASGDDAAIREAKADHCAKWVIQQMKSKAALVNKLDMTVIELIMHLE